MKHSKDKLSRRLEMTKEKQNEFEDRTIEITKSEHREIDWRKRERERGRRRVQETSGTKPKDLTFV